MIGDFLTIPEGNSYKKQPKKLGITERLKMELLALWDKSKKDMSETVSETVTDVTSFIS